MVGLGSAGRRHLRNLRALGCDNLHLLRTHRSTLPDDDLTGMPTHTDLVAALAQGPAGVVIATPSSLHLEAAIPAANAGCHLFIEKPISHTLEGIDSLRQAVASGGAGVLTGFQFRHHPGLRRIQSFLAKGLVAPPIQAQVHWGEYLPNWHPWEDYRQSYAARADLGGGVVLTLCHPFDYLRWLLGEVVEVSAVTANSGQLGIEVEDTADISLRFASGSVAQVHLDYLEQPGSHRLSVSGSSGVLEWQPDRSDRDTIFLEEMRHFLACVAGREQPVCTLDDGIAALRIALAVRQSAAEGRAIAL